MTLIEAIKSGRPYKRKVHGVFYPPEYEDGFSVASILADDWEVQEESITVTRSQVEKAWNAEDSIQSFNHFCKALGFEE